MCVCVCVLRERARVHRIMRVACKAVSRFAMLTLLVFPALAAARADERSCTAKPRSPFRAHVKDLDLARPWLVDESARRAPYYLRRARKLYARGLKQLSGKDKSNSDPFIKMYEAMMQILGALDLAPASADIWLEAGKVTLSLADLEEGGGQTQKMKEALSFLARACRLDSSKLDDLKSWLETGDQPADAKLPGAGPNLRKKLAKTVAKWSMGSVPDVPLDIYAAPSGAAADDDAACPASAAPGADSDAVGPPQTGDAALDAALASFEQRVVFPTYLFSTNLASRFHAGWCERIASIAVAKYTEFGELKRRERGHTLDPNDLNDVFFGWQITNEARMQSPEGQRQWPELYRDSDDFKLLLRIMRASLHEFVRRQGLVAPGGRDEDHDMVVWGAVYPPDGGRHGYHVHQSSLASCVVYLQTQSSASGPIVFVDPRGAPPVEDYEQHIEERDFEPAAPFHRNEHFFPESGDIVCFPSWLVHMVPTQRGATGTRVAFAANLQASSSWDAWQRTATV